MRTRGLACPPAPVDTARAGQPFGPVWSGGRRPQRSRRTGRRPTVPARTGEPPRPPVRVPGAASGQGDDDRPARALSGRARRDRHGLWRCRARRHGECPRRRERATARERERQQSIHTLRDARTRSVMRGAPQQRALGTPPGAQSSRAVAAMRRQTACAADSAIPLVATFGGSRPAVYAARAAASPATAAVPRRPARARPWPPRRARPRRGVGPPLSCERKSTPSPLSHRPGAYGRCGRRGAAPASGWG